MIRAVRTDGLLLPALLLLGALAVGASTLESFPSVYGDESYIGSTAWSFVSGHGFRPSIAVGAGVFDNGVDYRAPRLGTSPFVIAELIGPTSLLGYRLAAWLIGLAALGVFAWGIRALTGWRLALAASAALAASWGFYAASHYVRWDSLAILFTAGLLALLVRAPGPRRALAIGVLLGLGLDISIGIAAVAPAAALLVGWEREGRWRRLGLMGAGLATLGLVYYAVHVLPDPGTSSSQYDAIYGDTYKLPLLKALEQGSLNPIFDEADRYRYMWFETSAPRGTLFTLGAATLAALAGLIGVSREYPARSVPGILLLGQIVGVALILGNKAPIGLWYALPYAFAAIAVAVPGLLERHAGGLDSLSRGRRRLAAGALAALVALPFADLIHRFGLASGETSLVWPLLLIAAAAAAAAAGTRVDGERWAPAEPVVALFAALTIAACGVTVADARKAPPEPAPSAELRREVERIVGPDETAMGEWIYWWAFKDERFRFNSDLWLSKYVHSESLRDAFNRICPDVVMLDPIWLGRYVDLELGKIFPTQAPTDAAERGELRRILRSEYRLRDKITVDDRTIEFWAREGACDER